MWNLCLNVLHDGPPSKVFKGWSLEDVIEATAAADLINDQLKDNSERERNKHEKAPSVAALLAGAR